MDKALEHEQQIYRRCFSTAEGRLVLGNLLANAGVFDTNIKTPEELAVENFAKGILENMGLYGRDNINKVSQIIDALLGVQV